MAKLKQNKFITSDVEAILSEHISKIKATGKIVPTSVEEIADFPYESFDALNDALKNRDAVLLRFSFGYSDSMAQTLNPTFAWSINTIITFLFPILSIALSIFYSWWCLLGLFFFFIGLSRTKKLYNDTVFTAAMTNELAFCFLFFVRQISVSNADRSVQYFYDSNNFVTISV